MVIENRKTRVVIGLLLCLLTGPHPLNASTESPDWVHKKPPGSYVGSGTADSLEKAKTAALLDVVRQISYEISLKIHSSGEMTRTEKDLQLRDKITFSTPTISLSGQQIKDWHIRIGEFMRYEVDVLVRYPRAAVEKAIRHLRAEQAAQIARARAALRRGDTAWKNGRVMEALQTDAEAHRLSRKADRMTLTENIEHRIISRLRQLVLTRVSSETPFVSASGNTGHSLGIRLTIGRTGGASLPVAGVPILFRWDKPNRNSKTVLTDEHGEAVFGQGERRLIGVHKITAELDKKSLLAGLERITKTSLEKGLPAKVVFTLKVVPVSRPTRVLILIEETNMGHVSLESFVGQALSEHLYQAGFQVVSAHEIGRHNLERFREAIHKERLWPLRSELSREADLVVTGHAATRRGHRNFGIVISSHADLFIRAIDLKRDVVIAQKNVTGLAGFGDTFELAGIQALTEAGEIAAQSLVDQLSIGEERLKNDQE